MANVNIERMRDEVNSDTKRYVGPKYVSRFGIEYSWYTASNLDEGIRMRQAFAVKWRRMLLSMVEDGDRVTKRTVNIKTKYAGVSRRKATVYAVNGRDVLAVESKFRWADRLTDPATPGAKLFRSSDYVVCEG